MVFAIRTIPCHDWASVLVDARLREVDPQRNVEQANGWHGNWYGYQYLPVSKDTASHIGAFFFIGGPILRDGHDPLDVQP